LTVLVETMMIIQSKRFQMPLKMDINTEIFKSISRCTKAGFLRQTKPDEMNQTSCSEEILNESFKEEIIRIMIESNEDSNITFFPKHKFYARGYETTADLIIENGEEHILLGIMPGLRKVDKITSDALAYTHYVVRKAGYRIDKVAWVTVRKELKTAGKISLEDLCFTYCDREIKNRCNSVKQKLERHKISIRNNSVPGNDLHHYCIDPTRCPFFEYCLSTELPATKNVMELNNEPYYRKLELLWQGIITYEDVLCEKIKISDKSKNQIAHTVKHEILIDHYRLKKKIKAWTSHNFIWFLDIEFHRTIKPIQNVKTPYSSFPFAFTLYYSDLSKNITGNFQGILNPNFSTASMRALINEFLSHFDYNLQAPIVVGQYNKCKESLGNLAIVFPELKEKIENINSRLVDLRQVFSDQLVYDPGFKGSTYLKDIATAVCPDISYKDLNINSGVEAQKEFQKLLSSPSNGEQIRKSILDYSRMDAFSLLKIFEYLKAVAKA